MAHAFGNPSSVSKAHCLEQATHCYPCMLHKWNVFHIHQKVWEQFWFWHLRYCSLSSAIFLEEIAFRFLMDPHPMRSSLSPLLSEIPTKIIQCLEGMALPAERIEGNDANKTSKKTNKKLNKCLLCRCGHNVDDDVYGSSLSQFNIFPFSRGKFPKHNIVQPILLFHTQTLTFVSCLVYYICCRLWLH